MYRVTAGKQDQVSIDCGKARGAPKAKSYIGTVLSENYGTDRKGRTTTVNVFKRQLVMTQQQHEQSAVMKLAAMLPGVTGGDMNALRAGQMVTFDSVAEVIGDKVKENDRPGYVVNKDAASKMFEKIALTALLNSGLFRTVAGTPYLIVYCAVEVAYFSATAEYAVREMFAMIELAVESSLELVITHKRYGCEG